MLVFNDWVHAPVLWNLHGGIKLKMWDWVHWDLGSFLCSGSGRHRHSFICTLGRTRSIQGCSVVSQLLCSAALFYVLFRIQISKRELQNMITWWNLLKFCMSLFWHQIQAWLFECVATQFQRKIRLPHVLSRGDCIFQRGIPSAFSHVPQPGKNSSAAELPFKGNFQAKGTVGLLEDTSELLSN